MICKNIIDNAPKREIEAGMLVKSNTTGNIYLTLSEVTTNEDGEIGVKAVLINSENPPERCGRNIGCIVADRLVPFVGELTLIQE